MSQWLAEAILRGVDLQLISYEEIHYGIDEIIWNRLNASTDSFIKERMQKLFAPNDYYFLLDSSERDSADMVIKSKFRGIDPWILSRGKLNRLTLCDPLFGEEYERIRELMNEGWKVKLL